MKLEEFIQKYDDKFVEVSGSAPGSGAENQCVDLANAYIMEVLNKKPIFYANAVDFWTLADDSYERITPTDYPIAGDIIIWNTNVGAYGHIAVATGILNGSKFQTFSQNWPLKSPAHMQDYDLKNLIGYLRLKGEDMGFSDENMRLILESGFRQMRETLLGKVDEAGLKADVDNRLAQTKTGNVDGVKDQFNDYMKAGDLKWMKKSACVQKPCPPPYCPPCEEPDPEEMGYIKPEDCPKCEPWVKQTTEITYIIDWDKVKTDVKRFFNKLKFW